MIPTRMFALTRLVPVLAALSALAVSGAAWAQDKPGAKPASPATAKPANPAPSTAKPSPAKPATAKPTPSPVAQATLLGQFGDWGAYTATPAGRKVCFAISKPTSRQDNPPNRRTDDNALYMFVSTRPAEKVTNEVSLLAVKYAFSNADAILNLGPTSVPLQTQNDGAWVKNAADEGKLVETMRKGSDMSVKAATSRGTQTTDNFSLKGIAQALDRVAQECK